MNNTDRFCIERLWMLIRYEATMERARILALLRTFVIVTALPFAYGLITAATYSEYYDICIDYLGSVQPSMLIVCAATIFNIMEGKERATNYFMLPATNSEKLAAQMIVYTIGTVLLLITAYIVIECLHYPIVLLSDKPEEFGQSIAPIFFNIFMLKKGWLSTIFVVILGITIYNCFVNIRCRGYNWFVGSLIMVVIVALLLFAGIMGYKYYQTNVTSSIPVIAALAVAIITLIALVVFNYCVWCNSLKNFNKLAII